MFKQTFNFTAATHAIHRSLRTTLFLQTALVVSLTIFLLVAIAFVVMRDEIRRSTFDQLQSVTAAKEDLLENVISRQRQQISLLSGEKDVARNPLVRRMLGLEALFTLAPDGDIDLVKGEIPYDFTGKSVTTISETTETTFYPVFLEKELKSYVIVSPEKTQSGIVRHMVGIFDAAPLLSLALDSPRGEFANLYIGVASGDDFYQLHLEEDRPVPLFLGSFTGQFEAHAPLALAAAGHEGIGETKDYADVRVLAAYRFVPSIGWGIMATTDKHAAYASIQHLTSVMFIAGLLVLVVSLFLVSHVGQRITFPLTALREKLSQLETKQWKFERTIFTGNELEIVDAAAFDLTSRLRDSYQHLEQKVAERTKEVYEKNAQNEAVFRSIDFGMIVTDKNGIVTLVNDAVTGITGRAPAEVMGRKCVESLALLDKNGNAVTERDHPAEQVLRTGEKYLKVPDPGFILLLKTGKKLPVFVIATPILRSGECIGAVIIFRDVTEDRRMDKMKSEFIALASHQLRTPLSTVRWYVEMLASDDAENMNAEKLRSLQEIGIANDRMIRLVDSFLHTANLEMGIFSAKKETVDIAETIRSVVAMFTFEARAKQIEIIENMQDGVTLTTDIDTLKLILQNILSNAIKYSSERGNVLLSMEEEDNSIFVHIADEGIGIPAHQHSHIFEKLFRADNARSLDAEGNGLGLYIAKMAADAIGAEITFESAEKQGTTFTVKIKKSGAASGD